MNTIDESVLPALSDCAFTKHVLFVDLETSGLQHHIPDACTLSIGAVAMGLDGEVLDEFYCVIMPSDELMAKASPKALEVNGWTEEALRKEGIPVDEAWGKFEKWLKELKVNATRWQYVGQNPGFDLAFMEAEAPQIIKRYGWVPDGGRVFDNIDLYSVAESKFIVPFINGSRSRKGKNGKGLALALNVEPEPEIHNALEGAKLNYRVFTRMAQLTVKWRQDNPNI